MILIKIIYNFYSNKTITILFCNFIKITIEEKINIECIDDENIVFTISNDLTEKNCYLSIFDNQ